MVDLNIRRWGDGDRVAVLLHGMTTDSGSWLAVGPALAERGYSVVAPDLPGHGQSPRQQYTLKAMAESVIGSVPAQPDLAIGHSLGGLVLSEAIQGLRPTRVVYEDPPWGTPPGPEVADFLNSQRDWTAAQLAAFHPTWSPGAIAEKRRALANWDPTTTALVVEYPGTRSVPPPVPSLVIVGDTAPMIDTRLALELRREGHLVHSVSGAGHNIHNDDLENFLHALDTWIGIDARPSGQ